ncbi:MAG: hypothetical protein IVW36_10560 [Dehalococcoidia bacterium]|nr:hypothetical protein [Dehalococcoidia bacterium]
MMERRTLLERTLAGAERHLGSRLAPLLHRRHERTLAAGAVDPEHERRRRASEWWGDEPRWFAGGTPPRQHNRITPLIDGEAFFTHLAEALAGAQSYVYIVGWCLTPHVPLLRETNDDLVRSRLLSVLSEVAQRLPVRILLWGGAVALIQPTRASARETQRIIERDGSGDLVCALDRTAQLTHCHHQKAIVIDGQVAFVGGMDLTTFAGDRWDLHVHDLRAGVNWHDVTAMVQGEAVADVEQNFRERWHAVTGDGLLPHREPVIDAAWQTPAQIVRTIPRRRYDFAHDGEYGIHHAYTEMIRRARRLIYLESQYLWSPHVMDALIDALERPRAERFRIVLVLPARATSGKWDNDQHVQRLRNADAGRGIVEVYALYTSGTSSGVHAFSYRPTYVHAKIGVFDDEWLTIGSANLNNRGLITDSEINVVARDAVAARRLRADLWAEHLGMTADEVASEDAANLVDTVWKERARRNAGIIARRDRPLPSQVHRYETGRMPGAWLLEESEALTFEH